MRMANDSASRPNAICFVGDLVSPPWAPIALKDFKLWLGGRLLVANLEGPIVSDFEHATPKFNQKYSLASLPDILQALPNPRLLSVANNHFEDFSDKIARTPDQSELIGIAGAKARLIDVGSRAVALIGFAFPATDPARWRTRKVASMLTPIDALRVLEQVRVDHPSARIVAYVHWGYELSKIPYPADRAWARRAIDAGVDLIVGHHPHIPQPIENFGNGTVAYSLGNFYLPSGTYFGKRVDFDEAHLPGATLIYDGDVVSMRTIIPNFAEGDVSVQLAASTSPELFRADFAGLTDQQYLRHFLEQQQLGLARAPKMMPVFGRYTGNRGIRQSIFLLLQDSRQRTRDFLVRTKLRNPYQTSQSES